MTLNGENVYLGRWPEGQADPPPEVRSEYDRAVMEGLASRRRLAQPAPEAAAGPTVDDLLAAFWSYLDFS